MAADPIEERDIEKLLKMLDDPRVMEKVASKLALAKEVRVDVGGPHHDRESHKSIQIDSTAIIVLKPKGPVHP